MLVLTFKKLFCVNRVIINLLIFLGAMTFVNQSCKNIKYPNPISLHNDKIKIAGKSKIKVGKSLTKKTKSSNINLISPCNTKTTKIARKPIPNTLQNISLSKPKNNNKRITIRYNHKTGNKTTIDSLLKSTPTVSNGKKGNYNIHTNSPPMVSLTTINNAKVNYNKKILLEEEKESGNTFIVKKSNLITMEKPEITRIPIPCYKSLYTKTFRLKSYSNVNKRSKKQQDFKIGKKKDEDKFYKQGRIHPRNFYKISLATLIGVAAFGMAAILTVPFSLPLWGFLFTIAGVATFASVNIAAARHYYRCCKNMDQPGK